MANLRTPLYDWHVAHKARMVPFGGWDMPVQYTSIMEEHHAVRTAAGLFDIAHMGRFELRGRDALALIQEIFTNDAAKMHAGQVRYGLVCNPAGGILDDILVYRWPEYWSMIVNASNRTKIWDWLRQHSTGRDVQLDDQTLATTLVAIQGPNALALCHGMFDADIATLKYYYAMTTRYQGKPCMVSRTGYTGEDGFEIAVGNDQALSLVADLLARGAVPCGLGARDTLRLEAAMPLYGHELNETTTPLSAGLRWAVKLDKGDFIGRTALQTAPLTQRIGLELEGKRAAREGSPILDATGTPLGTVTSGSYGPTVQKSIAMGYVPTQAATVGTPLTVDIRGTLTPATVVPLPFYKRR
jgi:aminomethyltransferase